MKNAVCGLSVKVLFVLSIVVFNQGRLSAQNPQGFFLEDFQPKEIENPVFVEFAKPANAATTTVNVDVSAIVTPVSKYLFGNNANIFMTQMVDQPMLLDHIKTLSPNVIRFPGGNLSSIYFWNAANKSELTADVPEFILDANGKASDSYPYWYGGNTGNWTMSLDNYYKMLEMTSSTGMITINYAYARYSKANDPVAAAAHLAADWVRYDNGRTKYWEIGNESGGTWQAGYRINPADNKDGQPQLITGALYGQHFLVFADSMRKAATEIGATIHIGAQLLQEEPASWATATDKNWNAGVFLKAGDDPSYYIIHSYYTPYQTNSTPTDILNSATTVTKNMIDYVKDQIAKAGRQQKPIALTEWNIFAEGSKQQVSFVNGMHAAIVLGELIRNKYGQASRWDLANGYGEGNDHGMFSQGDEPDNSLKWNPRPVFYYMYYFQKYFGDRMVSSTVTGSSDILAYASVFDSGQSGLVLVNKGNTEQIVSVDLSNFGYGSRYYTFALTGGSDNGQFSRKVYVNDIGTTLASGGPANISGIKARSTAIGGGVKISAPSRSVVYLLIENGNNVITEAEADQSMRMEVIPNPSSGTFRIKLPYPGFLHINIFDLCGKSVLEMDVNPDSMVLDVRIPSSPGLFYLQAQSKYEHVVQKVVVE